MSCALGAESLVIVSPRVAITEVLRERSGPESGFEVRLADPSDMPFDAGSFGAAVFFEAGRSPAGEIEGVLRETERILDKEDGLLITSLGIPSVRTVEWQGMLQTLTTTLEELFSNVSVFELTIALTATFSSAPTAAALELVERPRRPSHRYSTQSSLRPTASFPTSERGVHCRSRSIWNCGSGARGLARDGPHFAGSSRGAEKMADERDYLIRELFASEPMLSSQFDLLRRHEVSPRASSLFRARLEALEDAQAEIADLRTSTSWRITKPLRLLKEILR